MSKKPDGKQGKKGKSNKGNKSDKKTVVAKAPESKKVREPKGPVPDYKHPKAKTNETLQTLESAWNGFHGLVSVDGMKLRFFAETSEAGEKTNRARLVSAPIKTALSDLGDYTTSIGLESAQKSSFVSDFEKGDPRYEVQAKLWKFLVRAFSSAGFKLSHYKKPDVSTAPPAPKAVEHKHETKASASLADFDSKKQGQYCFEESGPRAIISIEPVEGGVHAPQFGNTAVAQLKIKLVSVEVGHPLSGCRIGTYLYYNAGLFAKGAPFFKGSSASDCNALYEYVAGERRRYRKSVVEMILVPSDASQGFVVGDKVTTTAQEMLKAA